MFLLASPGPSDILYGSWARKSIHGLARKEGAIRESGADLAAHIVTHDRRDKHVVVRSKNISCSGLYCHLDRYIAPFQKLHLSIIVPLVESGRVHNEVIQLDAVTVRVEPEEEDPDVLDYHIAIFFENVSEMDQQIINRYVKQQDVKDLL